MSFSGQALADTPSAIWHCTDVPVAGVTTSRFNLASDPSCELNATDWGNVAGYYGNQFWSGVRATDQHFSGVASYKSTCSNIGGTYWGRASTWAPASSISPNTGYMISMYVRCSKACGVSSNAYWFDSSGNFLSQSFSDYQTLNANTWTRINRLVTSPQYAASMRAGCSIDSLNTGDVLWLDAVLIEQSSVLGTYFDGSTAGGGRWIGTAQKSTSAFDTAGPSTLVFTDAGNVYNGLITATGTSLVTGMGGVASTAMQFTAAGQASVPGSLGVWDMGLSSDKKWSIEFVARFDTTGGGTLLSTELWKIASIASNGIAFMPIGSSTGTGPTGVWANGAWHHYVVTFDGTTLKWYIDGSLVLTSTTFTQFGVSGTANLVFTASTAASLDEVVVYGHVLAPERVNAHYLGITDVITHYVSQLSIMPSSVQLILVQAPTQQLSSTAIFSDATTAPEDAFTTWTSIDTSVATVSSTGLVTAVGVGYTAIEARVSGVSSVGVAGVQVGMVLPALITSVSQVFSADPELPVLDSNGHTIGTTGEYWEVDQGRLSAGQWVYDTPVSLATYAWNVGTLAGRDGIPISDTENVRVALRPGRRWVPKTPDQRTLSLAMWVQGSDLDGLPPRDIAVRTKFMDNYNQLKKLFAVWDRQILLRRRVATPFGISLQQAFAEVTSNMDLAPNGPFNAAFTVDLVMADPFWYGPVESSGALFVRAPFGSRSYPRTYPLTYGAYSGNTGILSLNNVGTHDARLWAQIRGPVTNPSITDLDSGLTFRIAPDVLIDSQTTISIDFVEKLIFLDGTGSRYWWFDRTTSWLRARPGLQRFQFSHETTERDAYISWRWQPSYL